MRLPQTEGSVLPEWIDANGHMNLAYYVVLFDLATDAIYDAIGVGQAYRDTTGGSTFTAETHTLYEREVRVGERVRITSHVLGVDAKRLHYFHEMFHAGGAFGVITLRFGGYQPARSVHSRGLQALAACVARRSAGGLAIEVTENVVANGHKAGDLFELVASGELDGCY